MIRWGVIGLGNIAHRFVESLNYFENATFYAGGSHNPLKRKEFEEKYRPKVLYENYEDLLNDQDIDVVYIALPHNLHYEWSKKAMQHGKAVLVEKPSVLTVEEMKDLIECSYQNRVFFMEAMKTRFIPLTRRMHQLIGQGVIGEIKSIKNAFTFQATYTENTYHFDPIQGGALYDTGMYNISTVLDFIRDEILDVQVETRIKYEVDTYTKITLLFKNGKSATMINSMESEPDRQMVIVGTDGKMFTDPFYRAEEVVIEIGNKVQKVNETILYDDFYPEIEAVHEGINGKLLEHPLYPHKEMLKCVMVLEKAKQLIDLQK